MNKYWRRLFWNLGHLADTETPNPYVLAGEGGLEPVRRIALEDLTHSLKNIWVEARRNHHHE